MEAGADVNLTDEQGYTAPHDAARRGTSVPNARLLLESGAVFGARNDEGETPLDVARARGRRKMVAFFEEWAETHG